MTVRVSTLRRSIFIFVVLALLATLVTSDSLPVESGYANLTIYINDTSGNAIQGVNITLFNASLGTNTTYSFNSQTYSVLTDANGNATFINISIADNYSISYTGAKYYANHSAPFNISDGTAANVTHNFTLVEDNTDPTVAIVGQPTPSSGTIVQGSSTSFSVDFTPSDDLGGIINTSLYITNSDATAVYNQSVNVTSGTQTSFTIASITEEGNYSWFLNATDASGNSVINGPYSFFIDTTNANISDVTWIPGTEQNASQYINVTALVNGTYSEINYVRLILNDSTTEDSIEIFSGAIVSNISLAYFIPNSSAGSTPNLKLCYRDLGFGTSEQCTANVPITITDNSTPSISSIDVADQFIRSDNLFSIVVNATDTSDTNLNVTIQFFNGTDYVLNQSTTTHSSDSYSFSFIPSVVAPGLLENNYTVNVTAVDDFDNTYNMTTWVVIDDTPANITYAPLSTRHVKQGDVITLQVSVFDNYNESVDAFIVTADVNYSGFTAQNLSYSGGNLWETNITIDFAGDGDLFMNITALDIANNTGWNDTMILFADNTGTTVTINNPITNAVYNGTLNVTVALNYSLSEASNTTYYFHGGTRTILPSNAEFNHSFNATYPGKQTIYLYVNDSAGNIDQASVQFYEDFLLNRTKWITLQNSSNANTTEILLWNMSGDALPLLFNISDGTVNSTVMMDVVFSDGKMMNISYLDLYQSELNYILDAQIDNASFESNYEAADGASVIDYFRLKNFNKISAENISLRFNFNTTEFQEIYLCTNDYLSCTAISSSCGGSSCYYSDGQKTIVNLSSFPAMNTYVSVILVNDTIAPTISVTSPDNNTIFSNAYGNTISIAMNEIATCTYRVNTTRYGIQNATINSVAASSINYDLPNPPYLNGEYQFNISCTDVASNNANYTYHFSINDSVAPTASIWPALSTQYDKGTSSVNMQITTSELSVCKYNTTGFGVSSNFVGVLYSSSNNLTHTASVSVSDGSSYTYYFRCRDYNNNQYESYFSFSVSNTEVVEEPGTDLPPSSRGSSTNTTSNDATDVDVYTKEETSVNVTAGVTVNLSVSKADIPIKNIAISATRTTGSTSFTIESFSETSRFAISALPLQNTYRYIQIQNDKNLNVSELGNYTFEFKIANDWVAEYDLTHDDILLGRFDEATNTWQLIEKEFTRSDDDFVYYSATTPAATLFAISREETSSSTGNVITRDDIDNIDEGVTREFTSQKLDSDDVMMIVFGLAMVAIFGVVGYANRYKLMSIVSPKAQPVHATKKKGGETDLRSSATKQYAEEEKLPEKIQEMGMSSQELSVPNQEVLQKYLLVQFKNIWVKGYNDPSIKKKFIDAGWKKEQIDRAYEVIAADARENMEPMMADPKIVQLLDTIRATINEKYGFTKAELYTMLQQNGWPGYMIESALRALDAEMTVPYDFVNTVASSDLEQYIRSAKAMGATREALYQKLTSVGWPEHEVAELLNKEFQ
jgi:PGF-pre-PGF domain-containing protein